MTALPQRTQDNHADLAGPGVLDAHDVRYLSPAEEGRFGLPIGNGDLAAVVWTPHDRLQLAINKSNAWDDAETLPVPDWHWAPQTEERSTALVSCATLSVSNSLPLFDTAYLDDFEACLHLREGRASVHARSPLCDTQVQTFIGRDPDVLVVQYEEDAEEPVVREITLARWGSRRLFHSFAQISCDTSIGLDGTTSGCDEEHVWIVQQLRRISFAVVARFDGPPTQADCPNSHAARLRTQPARSLHGQLYLAVVTSEEHADPLVEAKRRVDAAARGATALAEANASRWAQFWSRSFVRLPGDPYLENLYYFSRYQLGASASGPYPPMHHGGLWMWRHDFGHWGAYYHWNQQQLIWPIHAAGHPELGRGYYAWRYASLGHAEATARIVHGIGGAFFTDIADRDGRQAHNGDFDHHLDHNLTCGTQIALDFWRHYQFTGDLHFLRTRAYPVMKSALQFYLEYLRRDADGAYHVPGSTGYEGHLIVEDCAADLAMIRQTLAACIEAAGVLETDAAQCEHWQHVLAHLADFTLTREGGQLVVASGIAREDGAAPEAGRAYHKGEALFFRGFWLPMAPAFPSGTVGLAQRGTPLFEAVRNSVRIMGPTAAGGWIPSAIFAARLGMAEEALDWLNRYVNHCQTMPQGFMQEGQYREGATDAWSAVEPRIIRDGRRTEERTKLLSWRHDVPSPECNCNLMTMIQEMLLQSHDGVIRIFPATPAAWDDAAFRLHAVGGFVVAAEWRAGQTTCVRIESRRGGVCRVESPWPASEVEVRADGMPVRVAAGADGVITFETTADGSYTLAPANQPPAELSGWATPSPGPRRGYGRMLGIERYF